MKRRLSFKAPLMPLLLLSFLAIQTAPYAARGGQRMLNGAAQQAPALMTPGQYREFLALLKTDLARCKSQLDEIDVHSLGVSFNRGDLIERALSRAKRVIEMSQKDLERLSKRQTLGDNVELLVFTDSLDSALSDIMDSLGLAAIDPRTQDQSRAEIWESQLLVVWKQVGSDNEKLFRHVLALADIADNSCPLLADSLGKEAHDIAVHHARGYE